MLREKISSLEKISKNLEPNQQERQEIRSKAVDYSESFLESIYISPAFITLNNQLAPLQNLEITEEPKPLDILITILNNSVDQVGLNPASEGHLGYIPGGGLYTSAVADYLADISNRYAGLSFGSPGAVKMENKLIEWSCGLIGYPTTAHGNLASGGSIANLIAITTARDTMKITPDKVTRAVIYLTRQTHHCIHKALRIAGLGTAVMRLIPLDDQYRMSPVALRQQIIADKAAGLIPFYVASSCGSTDTGAVDQLDLIADIAEEHSLWFHVDAAYGGYFILVEQLRHLFKGIERSDSVVLDPHKSLFLPYGTGIVLVKNGQALYESQHYMASYLQDAYDGTQELSPADLSPELTKHFRGLRMWLPLHLHGLSPFRAGLEEKHLLCKYFFEEVQKLGFEVGPYPQLSVAIYRYIPPQSDPNAFNEALVKEIQKDGRIFISSTTIDGTYWIRIAIVSFRTHLVTIDRYLAILKEKLAVLLMT